MGAVAERKKLVRIPFLFTSLPFENISGNISELFWNIESNSQCVGPHESFYEMWVSMPFSHNCMLITVTDVIKDRIRHFDDSE